MLRTVYCLVTVFSRCLISAIASKAYRFMDGSSFKDIEKLEAEFWAAADNLRVNSKLTSSDNFMSVLGINFLRHAANRFDAATRQIEQAKAAGKMPKQAVIDQNMFVGAHM